MSINRVLLAVTISMFAVPAPVHAIPDYPPSGAVVEIVGDVITGGVIEVRVRNCALGEVVVTSVDSLPSLKTICESPVAAFARPDEAVDRRPGISSHQLRLPETPGVLDGTVELLETEETLSFVLDVRGVDAAPAVEATPASTSAGLSGWPFLLLAALIVAGASIAAARHRQHETP